MQKPNFSNKLPAKGMDLVTLCVRHQYGQENIKVYITKNKNPRGFKKNNNP